MWTNIHHTRSWRPPNPPKRPFPAPSQIPIGHLPSKTHPIHTLQLAIIQTTSPSAQRKKNSHGLPATALQCPSQQRLLLVGERKGRFLAWPGQARHPGPIPLEAALAYRVLLVSGSGDRPSATSTNCGPLVLWAGRTGSRLVASIVVSLAVGELFVTRRAWMGKGVERMWEMERGAGLVLGACDGEGSLRVRGMFTAM